MLLSSQLFRILIASTGASLTWIIISSYTRDSISSLIHTAHAHGPSDGPHPTTSNTPEPQEPAPIISEDKSSDIEVPHNKHSVEKLWEAAKTNHASMLARQSQTLDDARKEYLTRYGIPPPDGYDEWFQYAVENQSPIIDEFDALMESLLPFRSYQENQCQFKNNRDPLPAMLPICVQNGTVDAGNPSAYDTKQIKVPFIDFTSEFVDRLPDMCFYINTFDEPRQVIPAEKSTNRNEGSKTDYQCEKHEFKSSKRIDVWDQVVVPCAGTSAARNEEAKMLNRTALIETWDSATDLCSFREAPPAGMIRCPENLSVTSAMRPVLSAASLSTFSDIMFPTLWRWRFDAQAGATWAKTDDITPWEGKLSYVGWRGSSNGGYAIQDNWRQFQRHRMVQLAIGGNLDSPYALESTEKLQQWLDVRFTNIVGCEESACEAMNNELPVAENQKLSETFKNKIVLDMDGHGLSGRFYMLLQSDSAVMKQGIVREWHDSRLIPWLHYIPLSMGMGELESMLEYLFGEGDHVLRSIAEEGKAWAAKALRRQDMRIYMYRLMLELGRTTFE